MNRRWVPASSRILLAGFALCLRGTQFSASQSHGLEDLLVLEGRLLVGLFRGQLLFGRSRFLQVHSNYSIARKIVHTGSSYSNSTAGPGLELLQRRLRQLYRAEPSRRCSAVAAGIGT